jgi:hypothetical protein
VLHHEFRETVSVYQDHPLWEMADVFNRLRTVVRRCDEDAFCRAKSYEAANEALTQVLINRQRSSVGGFVLLNIGRQEHRKFRSQVASSQKGGGGSRRNGRLRRRRDSGL